MSSSSTKTTEMTHESSQSQSAPSGPRTRPGFVYTRGHRRFTRFCEDVMHYRCIGLCVGPAGVGKTASARRYTKWDVLEPRYPRFSHTEKPPSEVAGLSSVFYTPPVISRPRLISAEIQGRRNLVSWFSAVAERDGSATPADGLPKEGAGMELLIVDEADWLKVPDLELLRSMHDREGFGLILIGLINLEKKLGRYDQLYSRVGFVHRYAPLEKEEIREMVLCHARGFGVDLPSEVFSDEGGISALVRESRGNFRLLEKLLQQCERVLRINKVPTVSAKVVDAARKALTFGEA